MNLFQIIVCGKPGPWWVVHEAACNTSCLCDRLLMCSEARLQSVPSPHLWECDTTGCTSVVLLYPLL